LTHDHQKTTNPGRFGRGFFAIPVKAASMKESSTAVDTFALIGYHPSSAATLFD
jgi:hypothetical protein